jgi:hypothetical protein
MRTVALGRRPTKKADQRAVGQEKRGEGVGDGLWSKRRDGVRIVRSVFPAACVDYECGH